MSAYAARFVNVNPGGKQWSTDLIGYDALNSYGSTAYYAQVMFASCLGTKPWRPAHREPERSSSTR
jgi:alpha-L-arabinofuranosidase